MFDVLLLAYSTSRRPPLGNRTSPALLPSFPSLDSLYFDFISPGRTLGAATLSPSPRNPTTTLRLSVPYAALQQCPHGHRIILFGRNMSAFRKLIENPPQTVPWAEVVDFDDLDERRSCIDCLYANILGVNEGYVEWCPNDNPPSKAETLAWLWFIRPDLSSEISADAPPELYDLIQKKLNGQMDEWWKEMTHEEQEAEPGSGLNDYPPSRPVLGRFAPGTGRAVGQS